MADITLDRNVFPTTLEAERPSSAPSWSTTRAFNSAAEILPRGRLLPRGPPPHLRRHGGARRAQPAHRPRHLKDELVRASAPRGGGRRRLPGRRSLDGVPRITNVEHWSRIIKEKVGPPEPDPRRQPHRAVRATRPRTRPRRSSTRPRSRSSTSPSGASAQRLRRRCARSSRRASAPSTSSRSRRSWSPGSPPASCDLDEMTSGLQKGDLVIVAARPAMGKTSFCLNIAQHAALRSGRDGRALLAGDVEGAARRCACCAPTRASTRTACAPASCSEKDWARLAKAYADLSAGPHLHRRLRRH